jgi:ABC-type amino acid transport substrate-binding protein
MNTSSIVLRGRLDPALGVGIIEETIHFREPGNMVLSIATRYYEKIMTTLTVKIPEALERSITIAARRERVTKSELVRRAMAKYVAQTGEDHKFQSALDLAGDLIGSVRGGPVDLATNAKYMDDYGK